MFQGGATMYFEYGLNFQNENDHKKDIIAILSFY